MDKLSKNLSIALVFALTATSITPLFSMVTAESTGQTSWINDISPPSIQFSIANGTTLYSLGNFSIGFFAQGCSSNNMILISGLYSVSYKASWQNSQMQVYQWSQGSANPQSNYFFYSVDLTNAPLGPQQIEVSVTGGGKNFGGGMYVGDFSLSSQCEVSFTVEPSSSASSEPSYSNSTWITETVDKNAEAANNCQIAIDSQNTPHLAYTGLAIDSTTPLVKYARWNPQGWSIQTIDEGSVDSLVLDVNGNPHILYEGFSGLMLAAWTGTNWQIQLVAPHGSSGSLALGSTGNPHVAFIDNNTIKYASWTGTNWAIQTLDKYPEIPLHLYLAIDKKNIPSILYAFTIHVPPNASVYSAVETVKLATCHNSSWSSQTIVNASVFENLVLDSKGNPHFLYQTSYPNNNLVYASWDGAAWNFQTVVKNVSLSVDFLMMDSNDVPHVAFAVLNGNFMYASLNGKAWDIQTVDINISPSSFALNSNKNLQVTYNGDTEEVAYYGFASRLVLMYAAGPAALPSQPLISEVTSAILFRLPAIITVIFVALIIAAVIIYRKHRKPT